MPKQSVVSQALPAEVLTSLSQLGARLRACRIQRGLSLQAMAQRMFCSVNTYRALEAGKPSCSVGNLVSALWLFGELDGFDRLAPVPAALAAGRRAARVKHNRGGVVDDLDF